jgi:DNA (cytosine-5)-methyltransferase 1
MKLMDVLEVGKWQLHLAYAVAGSFCPRGVAWDADQWWRFRWWGCARPRGPTGRSYWLASVGVTMVLAKSADGNVSDWLSCWGGASEEMFRFVTIAIFRAVNHIRVVEFCLDLRQLAITMPNAVDLFCGSGGVSQGLRAAGWRVLAACDSDPVASETFRRNHPQTALIEGDLQQTCTVDRIEAAIGTSSVDLLIICAPCQPFSSQNRHRGNDVRELLIIRALEVARRLKPQLIFFENVPGLATPAYRALVSSLKNNLSELGYSVSEPAVRDAADYGVPQRRRRCIMFAARDAAAIAVFESFAPSTERKSVFAAIGDLPPLKSGEAYENDVLHRARKHLPIALSRLKHIPHDGGSRRSLPTDLELDCHRGRASSFSDVYGRMAWQTVAPTLTTGCTDLTRGRFAHPDQDRAITMREAARLQSFPDCYDFAGNSSQISQQIGNAVPPDMITSFAPAFQAALEMQLHNNSASSE